MSKTDHDVTAIAIVITIVAILGVVVVVTVVMMQDSSNQLQIVCGDGVCVGGLKAVQYVRLIVYVPEKSPVQKPLLKLRLPSRILTSRTLGQDPGLRLLNLGSLRYLWGASGPGLNLERYGCKNIEYSTTYPPFPDDPQELDPESELKLRNRLQAEGDSALQGISDLTCLTSLDLTSASLFDISGIYNLTNLEHLEIKNVPNEDSCPELQAALPDTWIFC